MKQGYIGKVSAADGGLHPSVLSLFGCPVSCGFRLQNAHLCHMQRNGRYLLKPLVVEGDICTSFKLSSAGLSHPLKGVLAGFGRRTQVHFLRSSPFRFVVAYANFDLPIRRRPHRGVQRVSLGRNTFRNELGTCTNLMTLLHIA